MYNVILVINKESAPQPPERTKNKNKFADGNGVGPDPSTGLHALERTRTDSTGCQT